MNLQVRPATLDDSAAIAALSGQLGYKTSTENMTQRLSGLVNNTGHCVFIAADEGVIIGWIHAFYSLTVESDPLTEIAGLVIDENYQGKGIGRMLVKEVITWAATKKVKKVRVRSQVKRREAHAFYEHIGFTEVKEQKVFDLEIPWNK